MARPWQSPYWASTYQTFLSLLRCASPRAATPRADLHQQRCQCQHHPTIQLTPMVRILLKIYIVYLCFHSLTNMLLHENLFSTLSSLSSLQNRNWLLAFPLLGWLNSSTYRSLPLHQKWSSVAHLVAAAILFCVPSLINKSLNSSTMVSVTDPLPMMSFLAHNLLQHIIAHCMSWFRQTVHWLMLNCGATLKVKCSIPTAKLAQYFYIVFLHQTWSLVAQLVAAAMLICTSILPCKATSMVSVMEPLPMRRLLVHSLLQHLIAYCMSRFMHTVHLLMLNCGANTLQAIQLQCPPNISQLHASQLQASQLHTISHSNPHLHERIQSLALGLYTY